MRKFSIFLFFLLFINFSFALPGYYEPWGKDSKLRLFSHEEKQVKKESLLSKYAQLVIKFHQNYHHNS